MSTLHIFSSVNVSVSTKQLMNENDSMLLTQDACYISNQFNEFKGKKYVLEPCAKARGVDASASFTMISDKEFVTLVLNHHSNISW